MRFQTILTAVIAWAALAIIVTPNAHADRYLWLGAVSENWSNELNWFNTSTFDYPDGYPNDPSDDARFSVRGAVRITSGMAAAGCDVVCNLTIDSGTYLGISDCLILECRLTIENGGSLTIDGGGTVELAGDGVSHKIGGCILLTSSTSILLISGDASLDPFTDPHSVAVGGQHLQFGRVQGQNNNAQIQIKRGKTLTNNITVCGQMIIKAVP